MAGLPLCPPFRRVRPAPRPAPRWAPAVFCVLTP